MTRAEIVREISNDIGVDKSVVLQTVEAFMKVVKNAMAKNQNIYLRGFGTFIVKHRAQKTARNIKKNTTIIIPAHKAPKFKPSKMFVDIVKNNRDYVNLFL